MYLGLQQWGWDGDHSLGRLSPRLGCSSLLSAVHAGTIRMLTCDGKRAGVLHILVDEPGHEKPLMRQGITKKEMPLLCVVQAFLTPSLSFLLSQQ